MAIISDNNQRILFWDKSNHTQFKTSNKLDSNNKYVNVKDAHGVCSIEEAEKIITNLSGTRNIVVIAGHASNGIIGMGGGMATRYQKGKDICIDDFDHVSAFFQKIRSKMPTDPIPILFFAGCNVESLIQSEDESLSYKVSKCMKDTIVGGSACFTRPELGKTKLDIKFDRNPGKESSMKEGGARFFFNGKELEFSEVLELSKLAEDFLENWMLIQ